MAETETPSEKQLAVRRILEKQRSMADPQVASSMNIERDADQIIEMGLLSDEAIAQADPGLASESGAPQSETPPSSKGSPSPSGASAESHDVSKLISEAVGQLGRQLESSISQRIEDSQRRLLDRMPRPEEPQRPAEPDFDDDELSPGAKMLIDRLRQQNEQLSQKVESFEPWIRSVQERQIEENISKMHQAIQRGIQPLKLEGNELEQAMREIEGVVGETLTGASLKDTASTLRVIEAMASQWMMSKHPQLFQSSNGRSEKSTEAGAETPKPETVHAESGAGGQKPSKDKAGAGEVDEEKAQRMVRDLSAKQIEEFAKRKGMSFD
jgi:hypothetical protein